MVIAAFPCLIRFQRWGACQRRLNLDCGDTPCRSWVLVYRGIASSDAIKPTFSWPQARAEVHVRNQTAGMMPRSRSLPENKADSGLRISG
jgi:hypothetical protein